MRLGTNVDRERTAMNGQEGTAMSTSRTDRRLGSKPSHNRTVYAAVLVVLVAAVFLVLPAFALAVPPTLDGTVSSNTADGVSTISVAHTTGTGTNRLMLVGVSANSYNSARTISSVTFTPSGGSATALSAVGSVENEAGRLVAIYRLLNPSSGVAGTVAVNFSGSVGYGIVVGVANFAGVNQSSPLDAFVSAVGTETTAVSVSVPTQADDLVFDTVFLGAATPPTAAFGAGQTQRWNATVDRVRGVGSTELATGDTTQMSWTPAGATTYYWAIGAVPINPVGSGTSPITFTGTELLGRPTDTSVSISVVPDSSALPAVPVRDHVRGALYEHLHRRGHRRAALVVTISGLTANTRVLLPDADTAPTAGPPG